jgi:hypothetical protein
MSSGLFDGQAILFTVACGKPKYAKQAMALAMSARLHGAKAPIVVHSDCADSEVSKWFDAVVPPVPGIEPYLQKVVGLQTTGADRVLFLDSDSLAIKNLDELLDQLKGNSFAAMGDWITDGYYWGDTQSNLKKLGVPKIARMNGGLLYYERSAEGEKVIEESLRVSKEFDKFGLDRLAGKIHDEGCVSPALSTTGLGTLFDDSEGYSITPWTGVNVELDVLQGRFEMVNGYRGKVRSVHPYVYHSAMAGWDRRYWREVRKLVSTIRKAEKLTLESGKAMPFGKKVSRKLAEGAAKVYKKLFLPDF